MAATLRYPEWQRNGTRCRKHNCQYESNEGRGKILLTVSILLFLSTYSNEYFTVTATVSSPIGFTNPQPDGSRTPTLNIEGGPTFHRVFDKNDFTVVVDDVTGQYVYGVLNEQNKTIVSSGVPVGNQNLTEIIKLHDLGIKPGVIPSPEVMSEECGKYCADKSMDFDRKYSFMVGGITIKGADNRNHGYDPRHSDRFNDRLNPPPRLLGAKGNSILRQGVLRNIVILMKFADHDDRPLPTLEDFSLLFNGKATGSDSEMSRVAPSGSVRDVFLTSSYNKMELLSTVIGWVTLPKNEAYYADKTSGSTSKFEEAIRFALDAVDETPDFSFEHYDKDDNTEIDSLVFIHSGYAAEWGAEDCFGQRINDRIWSHKWVIKPAWTSKTTNSQKMSYTAKNYFTSSALWGYCGNDIARIGTLSHELGHVLDLPDLYLGGSGIGSYGLMGNSWGFEQDQLYPPILSSWSKIQMGWITPHVVGKSGRYTLSPIITDPQVLMIQIGFAKREYLLIENRQPIGFDAKLPRGGLVIYHIDEYAKFHKNPGFYGQVGWPENGNHYRVAIVQSDGKYNLEKGENRGDESDVFGPGDELRPGDNTYPNTDSYRKGVIKKTGIHIDQIVQETGGKISFSIKLPEDEQKKTEDDVSKYLALPLGELVTTFAADIGSNGCMFDVVAGKNAIIVFSLDTHVRVKKENKSSSDLVGLQVYAKKGSHKTYERNRSKWQLICNTSVKPAGFFQPTIISEEDFQAVTIQSGATHAFYIVLDSPDLRYSKGKKSKKKGAPAASNSDLEILEGTGVKGKFGKFWSPRIFNGIVKYRVIDNPNPRPMGAVNTMQDEEDYTLTTTFSGKNGNDGIMFNVFAIGGSVTVRGMDVHLRKRGNVGIEVYTKSGVYGGYEVDELAWTLICKTDVIGQGNKNPTTIPPVDFDPVRIEQGTEQGFYVTVLSNSDLRYSNSAGSSIKSDGIIEIRNGSGLKYKFGKPFRRIFTPRDFNGSIKYSVSQSEVKANAVARTNRELLTTFAGQNGSYGIMFDIKAKNDVILEGIDIHTRAKEKQVSIKLYKKEGTFVGHEMNLDSWTQLCSVAVLGSGSFERTSLPDDCFSTFTISGGTVIGLYITLTSKDLRYTNEGTIEVGEIYQDNDDIGVMVGTGIGNYPIVDAKTDIYPKRIFNGALKYTSSSQSLHSAQITRLQTMLDGGNRGYGNIFMVEAKERGVKIVSIDFHTRISTHTFEVEVWTRPGSYVGHTNSMDGWQKVASLPVIGRGEGKATVIDPSDFEAVEILPNQSRAFYISLNSADMLYTNGNGAKTEVASDDGIIVFTGMGVFSRPLTSTALKTFNKRVFNGNINYVFV